MDANPNLPDPAAVNHQRSAVQDVVSAAEKLAEMARALIGTVVPREGEVEAVVAELKSAEKKKTRATPSTSTDDASRAKGQEVGSPKSTHRAATDQPMARKK